MVTICGIAGFYLTGKDKINPRTLSRRLLAGIDTRGGDATGAAWWDADATTHHYVTTGNVRQFLRRVPDVGRGARTSILHARLATQGSIQNPLNNHPVVSGNYYLVHNGMIGNDREIFDRVPIRPRAQVDSEALVALVRAIPKMALTIPTALEIPEGSMAIAWVDEHEPETLHLARGASSPLAVCQFPGGSVVFASTTAILAAALDPYLAQLRDTKSLWWAELPEGTYLRVHRGQITDMETFDAHEWWYGYKSSHVTRYPSPTYSESSADWEKYLSTRYGGHVTNEEVDALERGTHHIGECFSCGGVELIDHTGNCIWCSDYKWWNSSDELDPLPLNTGEGTILGPPTPGTSVVPYRVEY